MCRHGCFATQKNDQGREFVNGVSSELHRLTGIEQRVTSAYHPQSNGLLERQNRTIKNALVKILDENPSDWHFIVEGVIFAHRVSIVIRKRDSLETWAVYLHFLLFYVE